MREITTKIKFKLNQTMKETVYTYIVKVELWFYEEFTIDPIRK